MTTRKRIWVQFRSHFRNFRPTVPVHPYMVEPLFPAQLYRDFTCISQIFVWNMPNTPAWHIQFDRRDLFGLAKQIFLIRLHYTLFTCDAIVRLLSNIAPACGSRITMRWWKQCFCYRQYEVGEKNKQKARWEMAPLPSPTSQNWVKVQNVTSTTGGSQILKIHNGGSLELFVFLFQVVSKFFG